MQKEIVSKCNRALETYLNSPRKSWTYGRIIFPIIIIFYVKTTMLTNDLWENLAMGVFTLVFITFMSLVTFESRKWRTLPMSVLIMMGFSIVIVGAIASVTENTPDQVLNSTLYLMSLFGLFGLCGGIMGIMIHKSYEERLAKLNKS